MTVYHISRKGAPAPCRAREGNCPLSDVEGQAHGTRDEVLQAIEATYSPRVSTPLQKGDQGREKIVALRDELHAASLAYYQGGASTLTDDEYDDRKAYMEHLLASGPEDLKTDSVIRAILEEKVAAGTGVQGDVATIERSVPMLSQRKADSREAVEAYLNEATEAGATGFKLQAKLDGISFAALYRGGKLVHCTGRGDGSKGQDYTGPILSGSIKVDGLPLELSGNLARGVVELRGELFIRHSHLKAASAQGEKGNTSQIMVSSGLTRGSSKATYTFTVFSQVAGQDDGFSSYDADELSSAGFIEVTELTTQEWSSVTPDLANFSSLTNVDELMAQVDDFGRARPSLDIPTDGIVIKPVNEVEMHERMGFTAHHPKSQVAFKYTGAMAVTPLESVSFAVRGDGEVAASVSFGSVDLAGKNFARTTLPYVTLLEEVDMGPGSDLLIEKYRDQSAKYRSLQSVAADPIRPPGSCPTCGNTLERTSNRADPNNRAPLAYTTLRCTNQQCRGRVEGSYGRRGVEYDGLGPAKVKALLASGKIETAADLAKLTTPAAFMLQDGTYPKGITANNVAALAQGVAKGRASLQGNLVLGLESLNLYGLTSDRASELAKTYRSTREIEVADVRKLAESFSEDLHETELTHMLDTPEACAERLQAQLRESIDLRAFRSEGIIF